LPGPLFSFQHVLGQIALGKLLAHTGQHGFGYFVRLPSHDECHPVHFVQTLFDQERVQFGPLPLIRRSFSSTARRSFA
jgi:hypothetical protein